MGLTQRELCPNSENWYAVTVRHQHERAALTALEHRRVSGLLPLYTVRSRWSDRVQTIQLPLFAGYVFCRFDPRRRAEVLTTPGVRSIVGFGGSAQPIAASEIEAIERLAASKLPVGPWPYLRPGGRVRIERGPLRGLEGTLLREKDVFRLVIGVELLQRSIAAELSPEMITPC